MQKLDPEISVLSRLDTFVSPSGRMVAISHDDEAMKYAEKHELVEMSPERERRLLWKIDLYVMPLICILYACQFMDKLSNSYAAVLGLRDDLHMHGNQYSWTGLAFYLGYLAFEMPAALSLQRFPVVRVVSVYIVIWGALLCLHATPNYAGFIALRVLLGMCESAVTPAFVIITSQWYKKEEVFLRTAIWFCCNGVGTIVGSGVISYPIFVEKQHIAIAPWKLVFLITGALTIVVGVLIFFHLPSKPTDAWFLSEEERVMVVERIRTNQQGFGNKHFKWSQFREALLDIKTWLFFVLSIANNIPNGGLTNFQTILLHNSFGYGTRKTLLMNMISGAVEFVGCSFFAYCYQFYKVRMFWATASCWCCFAFLCMLGFSTNRNVQMAGVALYGLNPLTFICILSSVALNVTGHTKKVTVNAIFLIGYCVGNLVGPQTFRDNQAPNYTGAKVAMVVTQGVSGVVMVLIWIYYVIENKRRDRAHMDTTAIEGIENHEFADLTDMENPLFRYII